MIRFSGTLAAAYGQETSPAAGAGAAGHRAVLGRRRARRVGEAGRRPASAALAAACLAVVVVNTIYLVSAVLGGATSVNLANSGTAFEYFYTTTPELAAARGWAVRPARRNWSTRTSTASSRWLR